MRRDNELMTKILLALEADEPVGSVHELAFLGDDLTIINRHVGLLADKGLVEGQHFGAINAHPVDWPWMELSLTNAGHDVLEETRKSEEGRSFVGRLRALGKIAGPDAVRLAITHPDYLSQASHVIGKFISGV